MYNCASFSNPNPNWPVSSNSSSVQICPGLNANEIQIQIQSPSQGVLISEKTPKHTQLCQIWSNMKMPDNPAKHEVAIKQYLSSILDISGSVDRALQDKTADKSNNGCKTKLKLYVKQVCSATWNKESLILNMK